MARIIVAKNNGTINDEQKDLVLDSNVGNLMIIDEQLLSGSTTEYTHGLGYLPTSLEFFNSGTEWHPVGQVPAIDKDGFYISDGPFIDYDTNKLYISNPSSFQIKILISGNAADNQIGSGKNTASGKIKIAKDNLDIYNISDVRQFKFCSGLDTIKRDSSLSGSFTFSSTGFATYEINHNLGYVPVVMAKLQSNTYDSSFNGTMLPINITLFDITPVSFYITDTKLVFFTSGIFGDFTIKYNIYRNKIN